MIQTGSMLVNGQLIPEPTPTAYNPLIFGPAITGAGGGYPRRGPYLVPPMVGASMSGTATNQTSSDYASTQGLNTSSSQTLPSVASATGNVWNMKHSPVIWGFGFLVIGLLGLRYVHWGKK